MAKCTAPVRGHSSAAAAARCPACRYKSHSYSGYGSSYSSYGGGRSSYTSSSGGSRTSSSARPRWSRSGSSVSYTPAQVQSLAPIREAVEISAATQPVTLTQTQQEDYICITDIAKYKNPEAPRDIIKNWMRSKNTIELLGLWERLNNPNFKQVEFDLFRNEAGGIQSLCAILPRNGLQTLMP